LLFIHLLRKPASLNLLISVLMKGCCVAYNPSRTQPREL